MSALADFLAWREQNNQRSLQAKGRAEQALGQEQATVAAPGLARTLSALGMGPGTPQAGPGGRLQTPMNPQAASAVRLMMDPGTRQFGAAQAQALLTPPNAFQMAQLGQSQLQFEQSLALDKQRAEAYVTNMTIDNATKQSTAQRAALTFGNSTNEGLRKEFNTDPLVIKASQAETSFQQLRMALKLNNYLALQAAIVASVQIQEPGLAVRNDDRIAYSGNNSIAEQLVALYNKSISGEQVPPDVSARMLALGTELVKPHAHNLERVRTDYRDIATRTPGANPSLVVTGSGIDEGLHNFLLSLP